MATHHTRNKSLRDPVTVADKEPRKVEDQATLKALYEKQLKDFGKDNMANPFASCGHSFKLIKSESSILYWTCQMCHLGPHWFIFECKYCRIKTCRNCTHCA